MLLVDVDIHLGYSATKVNYTVLAKVNFSQVKFKICILSFYRSW